MRLLCKLLLGFFIVLLTSCEKTSEDDQNRDNKGLFEKYMGTYKVNYIYDYNGKPVYGAPVYFDTTYEHAQIRNLTDLDLDKKRPFYDTIIPEAHNLVLELDSTLSFLIPIDSNGFIHYIDSVGSIGVFGSRKAAFSQDGDSIEYNIGAWNTFRTWKINLSGSRIAKGISNK